MQRHYAPFIILIIALVLTCGCFGFQAKSQNEQVATTVRQTVTTIAPVVPTVITIETTVTPQPTQDPFPNALKLKQTFNFSSGKSASEGTVYRYWMNDTYQLFDPRETRYVTKYPASGNKYLIIFVNVVNRGTARTFPPSSSNIIIQFDGKSYYPDTTHALPKTEKNKDSPPEIIRIGQIEFFHKLYGSEYVEDFGFFHGMEQSFLTPGESNAIDGYIIYEVPASLTPEKTYVEIGFNSQASAVWKLK